MADAGNYKTHERTFHGFMRLLKVGTIISAVLAAVAVWLIAG